MRYKNIVVLSIFLFSTKDRRNDRDIQGTCSSQLQSDILIEETPEHVGNFAKFIDTGISKDAGITKLTYGVKINKFFNKGKWIL